MKAAWFPTLAFAAIFAPPALAAASPPAPAPASASASAPVQDETMSVRTLKQIVDRQKTLLADAEKQGDKLDVESFRVQVQELCHEYELLLLDNPKFAAAYASYGYLLSKMDMPKEAVGIMLKANQLDPDIPLVKNQIGNYLVEDGQPLEAMSYFTAAIKLEPNEPLYHYQLGTLLHEARADFLKSGDWTSEQVDNASHEAFRRAAELAPDRVEFTYRYAESFADLPKPDWDEALKTWAAIEAKVQSPQDKQVMRLQEANVLIKQGKTDRARAVLDTVTDPGLDAQKQKLVAQLPPAAAK